MSLELPAAILEHACGCGAAWRSAREGETVLDVGCGAGAACFRASERVGVAGRVIGVDASAAMLAVAREHAAEVARRVGWENVRFAEALAEDLGETVEAASVDLAILDCVWSHVTERERPRVAAEILRALRPGGRLLLSEVVAEPGEIVAALERAGFERVEVVERSEERDRTIGGVACSATTVRAIRPAQ